MKRSKLIIGLLAALIFAVLGWAWLMPDGLGNSPEITLLSIDGDRLPLAEQRGNPLLLVFWSTTCPECIREMPHLVKLYNELSPGGLEIIAVAMRHDRPSDVLAMREQRKLPYPVALDLDGEAALAFGNVRVTPTSILVAPDGRIVLRKTGRLNMNTMRNTISAMLQPAIPGGAAHANNLPGA